MAKKDTTPDIKVSQDQATDLKRDWSKLNKPHRIRSIVAYVALSLLVATVATVAYSYKTKKVDCKQIFVEVESLKKIQKYDEAYKRLSDNRDNCVEQGKKSSAASKRLRAQYNAELANSAYWSGDNKQARSYAKDAIDDIKTMPTQESDKLPNGVNLVFEMSNIINDSGR